MSKEKDYFVYYNDFIYYYHKKYIYI